jgi:hypothetical protein
VIYLFAALMALLFFIRRIAPVRYGAHAARAGGTAPGIRRENPWLAAGLLRDEEGHSLSIKGRFVGAVSGSSMEAYGLRSGATFLAEFLGPHERSNLKRGEIVVVDAPAQYSPINYRLRCIEEVKSDGMVRFRSDHKGRRHTERTLSTIMARVTHVVL